MSPSQQVLYYLLGFCTDYHWTLETVLEMDLETLLDITIVNNKINEREEPQKFIDDIL